MLVTTAKSKYCIFVEQEQLCTQRMPCSGWQLQRADRNLDQHACGGVHFPRSRLLTADMGTTLMVLANHTRVDWQLCFSSFQDDASSPTAFHKQCDMYNTTMVVVRNSLGFTFGGYVRVPYRVFVVFHQLLLAYSTR